MVSNACLSLIEETKPEGAAGVWRADAASSPFNRRSFMICAASAGIAGGLHCFAQPAASTPPLETVAGADDARFITEARFYEKLPNRKVKCKLCPRECSVGDRERGYCGVRENRGGTYYTLVHSRVCATHVDPVEKKPLFRYLPGSLA